MLVVSSGFFFCGTGHCFHRNCFCCLEQRLDNSRTIQRYKKGRTKDCFIHTNELLSRAFFECIWKNCALFRASFNALLLTRFSWAFRAKYLWAVLQIWYCSLCACSFRCYQNCWSILLYGKTWCIDLNLLSKMWEDSNPVASYRRSDVAP